MPVCMCTAIQKSSDPKVCPFSTMFFLCGASPRAVRADYVCTTAPNGWSQSIWDDARLRLDKTCPGTPVDTKHDKWELWEMPDGDAALLSTRTQCAPVLRACMEEIFEDIRVAKKLIWDKKVRISLDQMDALEFVA